MHSRNENKAFYIALLVMVVASALITKVSVLVTGVAA